MYENERQDCDWVYVYKMLHIMLSILWFIIHFRHRWLKFQKNSLHIIELLTLNSICKGDVRKSKILSIYRGNEKANLNLAPKRKKKKNQDFKFFYHSCYQWCCSKISKKIPILQTVNDVPMSTYIFNIMRKWFWNFK